MLSHGHKHTHVGPKPRTEWQIKMYEQVMKAILVLKLLHIENLRTPFSR